MYVLSSTCFQESYTYKDPITEFVECLYVNFDFDSAQKKLRECESVSNLFSNLPNVYFSLLLPNCEKQLVLIVPLRDRTKVFSGPLICESKSWTFNCSIVVNVVGNNVICLTFGCSYRLSFCWTSTWVKCRHNSDGLCLVSYCQI